MDENKKKTSEDYINEIYDAQMSAQKASMEQDYRAALTGYDDQQVRLDQNARESSRQAAVQSERQKANWNEVQNAYGLSTGARAQGQLAFGNQLQQDLTAINTAHDTEMAALERQRATLAQQYASAITQAQKENDFNRAQALYQAAQAADAQLLSQRESAAALMAQAGDFSLYAQLYGLTPEQVAKLDQFYQEGRSGSSSGGSSYGSGYYGSGYDSGWYGDGDTVQSPGENDIITYPNGMTTTDVAGWAAEYIRSGGSDEIGSQQMQNWMKSRGLYGDAANEFLSILRSKNYTATKQSSETNTGGSRSPGKSGSKIDQKM